MKINYLMSLVIFLGALPVAVSANSSNGAVHICIQGECEALEDEPVNSDYEWREQATYYHNHIFDDPEEDVDMPGWLENETQWPGQREEFSDYFMR